MYHIQMFKHTYLYVCKFHIRLCHDVKYIIKYPFDISVGKFLFLFLNFEISKVNSHVVTTHLIYLSN